MHQMAVTVEFLNAHNVNMKKALFLYLVITILLYIFLKFKVKKFEKSLYSKAFNHLKNNNKWKL